jgi:hypothetical protein
MTEPTLPQNLTACRHFNSAALVKIVVASVCHGGLLSSVDERDRGALYPQGQLPEQERKICRLFERPQCLEDAIRSLF